MHEQHIIDFFFSNRTRSLSAVSSNPSVTLTNLKKYGQYRASVKASTRLGDGGIGSPETEFETLEDGKLKFVLSFAILSTIKHETVRLIAWKILNCFHCVPQHVIKQSQ